MIEIIIPVIIYLLISTIIPIMLGRRQLNDTSLRDETKRFSSNYFIGGRSLGGFVLAMTISATYFDASSYFGGPGIAYSRGLSWVYLAMIQVPVTFLILGVYGKRLGMVARKINAVTLPDYIRHRYNSNILVAITSIAIMVFFVSMMVANFMGGAIILQTMTGVSYAMGLCLFSVLVVIYTSFGGFKAVVIGDAIQGVVMLLGAIVLLGGVIHAGGGMDNIGKQLNESMPYWSDATAGGIQSKVFTTCFWVLVGYAIMGLPQTALRNMAFRDSKSVHNGMIISTIMLGFLMLVTHFCGGLSRALISPDMVKTSDAVVPTVAAMTMPPILVGVFLAGCLAAVMSTVSSILISCTSSLAKDLWLHRKEVKDPDFLLNKANQRKYRTLSMMVTLGFGIIAFIISLNPPTIISFMNLFAAGGLEAVFLFPVVGGLYWKRANKQGAILAAAGGFIVYLLFQTVFAGTLGDVHASIPGLTASLILFIVGSITGKRDLTDEKMEVYFPTK